MIGHEALEEQIHILRQWESVPPSLYPHMRTVQASELLEGFSNLLGMVEVLKRVWYKFSFIMKHSLKLGHEKARDEEIEGIEALRFRVAKAIRDLAKIDNEEPMATAGDIICFVDMAVSERDGILRRKVLSDNYDGGWDVNNYGWLAKWWPVRVMTTDE